MPKTISSPYDLSYPRVINYLFSLKRFGIRMGLEPIKKALHLIGDPQDSFPTIHVGGTNGKGSTSAMLEAVLKSAGYRVGLYTSPHLVRLNERLRVDGIEVSNHEIIGLFEKVKGSLPHSFDLTFFEFITAMAFLYFAEQAVDIAIIEVGMGGRLDATNTIKPLVSVITNVSMEHEDILGNDIKKIAAEKAAITKTETPMVTAATGAPLDIIKDVCLHKEVEISILGRDFSIREREKDFDFVGSHGDFSDLRTNLIGQHQHINAACSLEVIGILNKKGFSVGITNIRKGLKNIRWPGRMEVIMEDPTVALDCAHNPSGADTLKETLKAFKYQRLILVIGIMDSKDIDGIVSKLAPLAFRVIVTRPDIEEASSIKSLSEQIKPYASIIDSVEGVSESCKVALSEARSGDLILITGSVFTVGEAMEYFNSGTGTNHLDRQKRKV